MSSSPRSKLCTKDTVKFEGLNVWVDGSADGQPAKVDIILVQGLGSHPYYTWTGRDDVSEPTLSRLMLASLRLSLESGNRPQEVNAVIPQVFWPRDLLPQHLPPSRIATYSYKSDWRSRHFKANLRECGNQLLNIIHQNRRGQSIPKRPIVFIGHSLGGLVIQQALVIADHGSTFEDIRKSTAGAIFLGVPHQGSDYAGFADLLTRACKNDQPLLRNLKARSPDLSSLASDFWSEYGRLPAVCFYEKNDARLGPINIKMVSSQSASVVEKRMIYLNTDHSGLNKFRHEDDENFQLLLRELMEIAKDAVSRHHEVLATKRPIATTMVPFPRDENFVEREEYMRDIATALGGMQSRARVALVGLGGIGKSQIAIEYAYRVREHDQEISIFWVHASSPARFLSSYRSVATELKLPGVDDPNANILDMVHAWLASESSGRWLILLDNADDARFVHADYDNKDLPQYDWTMTRYLPHRAGGAVLITTRSSDAAFGLVDRGDMIVNIEPMSHDEAKMLLHTKISNRHTNEDEENDLITELEHIPLAITQAAAYLSRSPRMTIRKYLERLRSDEETRASILSVGGGDLRRDPVATNSVIRTWQMSFNQIKSENQLATDLLARMCMFDKQGIPESLLKKSLSDHEYNDAIEVLLSFSLVRGGMNKSGFEIHRLVQLATRTWLRIHRTFESQSIAALKMLAEHYPFVEYKSWTTCQILEPHVEAVLSMLHTSDEARLFCARLLLSRSRYVLEQGQYVKAEVMAKRSLSIREELLGQEDQRTVMSKAMLLNVHNTLGSYTKAEVLGVEALKVCEKLNGGEHPDTLNIMFSLAFTYRKQNRWGKAETLHLQVLDARRRLLGEEHINTLNSMGGLAHVYHDQKRWSEAQKLEVRVLEIRKRVLGEEHPATLAAMNNLAQSLRKLGQARLIEVEKLNTQVLETAKKVLGEGHPRTLTAAGNLAATLTQSGKGRWDEVKKLQVQVLETSREVLGEKHPDTLKAMANLAHTLTKPGQGSLEEAEHLEVQVLETMKKVLGEDHKDTLTAMAQLAYTYYAQGRLSKAIDLMTQAYQRAENIRGASGVEYFWLSQWTDKLEKWKLDDIQKRAREYWDQGLWNEAEELETKALEMSRTVQGEKHYKTIACMSALARTYHKQGRISAAIEVMTKALHDTEVTLGQEKPDTIRRTKRLEQWKLEEIEKRAGDYWDQGFENEAEELYVKALETSKTIHGETHPKTLTCTRNLAYTYYEQLRISAAIELMTKAVHGAEVTLDEDDPNMRQWTKLLNEWRAHQRIIEQMM